MRDWLSRLWYWLRPPAARRIAKDKIESANLIGVMEAIQETVRERLSIADRELQIWREHRGATRH